MSTAWGGLGKAARTMVFVALASLGLGGCCGSKAEQSGPSFRAPTAEKGGEKATEKPAEAPSAVPAPSEAKAPSPAPTLDLPGGADRKLGIARRLGKLQVDPNGPKFASATTLTSHFRKHGVDMGFANEDEYLAAAQAVMSRKDAERFARKGDQLFFRTATGEFAVLSGRGAIRTYFIPSDPGGYWQRQKDGQNTRDDDEPRGRRGR